MQDGGFNIGSTALIRAAGAGHLKVVKYLHEKGADRYASVFARFAGGGTYTDALGYARTCGHKEVAAFLQKAAGSELWQAHRDGNLAEVKRLLEYFRSSGYDHFTLLVQILDDLEMARGSRADQSTQT